jgi:tetratricopeptide (TPR) repeat protein
MKKITTTLLLWGVMALTACAPHTSPPVSTAPAERPASPREDARKQIAGHLQAGRYQAALDLIEKERRRSGSPRLLEEEYLQVLRGLSAAGEASFAAGEYERSGQTWRLVLNHYPKERTAVDRLGINRQDLQDRLELCAERLMAQGLVDYRAGNLPAAIETWKKILVFYSDHDGAMRGIQTAEVQLKNLRALP